MRRPTFLLVPSLVLGLASGARAQGAMEQSVEPERERILLIGDSHVTSTFGKALDLLLRTRDAEVTTVGSCGVTPAAFSEGRTSRCGILRIEDTQPDWTVVARRSTETPRISKLLEEVDPDLTIIELGANQLHLAYKDPEGAIQEARTLAETVVASGSRCLWVGPPAGRSAQKPEHKMHFLYWVLEEAVGDLCRFTDSRPSALRFLDYERITAHRAQKGDGRHFDAIGVVGQQLARRWALTVFEETDRYLEEIKAGAVAKGAAPEACLEVRASAREKLSARFAAR